MRYARFILSSVALVFGILILAVSFSTANTALSAEGNLGTSSKQFYMGQTILPDHLAYPLLMAMDKAHLVLSNPHDRIFTEVEYSQRRFEYALALLEKDNSSLALTTLSKSQKYLNQAAQDALQQDTSVSVKQYLIRTLAYYQDQLVRLKPRFSDAERPTVDDLIRDNLIMSSQLNSAINASQSAGTTAQ